MCITSLNPTTLATLAMISFLLKLLVATLLSLSLAHAADGKGRRIALVIGNGNYQHPDLPKLANPPNDAEDIAKALRGFGFEVIERKNQTLEGMNRAIAEFGSRIGGSEAALFYFAGHGIQVKNQNYLIPVNAVIESEASVPYQGVNLNQILDELDNAKSRANIVMLDACRNNPISGKFRSVKTRGLASPDSAPKGTVIVYATDPGNVASDGTGRNGLFTSGLLTAFKGSDLSLDGVLTVASTEVERASENTQTPYVNGPKTLQKNFHFRLTVDPGRGEIEKTFWTSIERSSDPADFAAYLKKYPQGSFVALAENRLRALKAQQQAAAKVMPDKAMAESGKPPAAKPAAEPERKKAHPAAEQPEVPGKAFRDCPDCPEMVVIPAGAFDMGTHFTFAESPNETPQHPISIAQPLAMAKGEISRGQFAAFVKESRYATADGCWIPVKDKWKFDSGRSWRNPGFPQQDAHPVVCVSWNDAQAYAAWLSGKTGKDYRLPSEAEWEYAVRAGSSTPRPWGNNPNLACEFANVRDYSGQKETPGLAPVPHKCSDNHPYTAPVGSFKANDFGLFDMIGNAYEWTQDCANDDYKGAPSNGSAWTQGDCKKKIHRGGSWASPMSMSRSAARRAEVPASKSSHLGFRVVSTLR